MDQSFGITIDVAKLTGARVEQVRKVLWNTFDEAFRPEMQQMERRLVLDLLDNAWKSHLLTMDHLRSVVGLRGHAQEDPKTVYKKEGMAEFGQMWDHLNDRVTDTVFRMEDAPDEEISGLSTWFGAVASQARTVSTAQQARSAPDPLANTSTNSGSAPVKAEPIRRSMDKVGRNDPCPCGSGKKYKNCHMKSSQPI